jgi:hypothetical protein
MPSFSTAERISLTVSLTFWVTPSSWGRAFFRYSTITPSFGLSLLPLYEGLAHFRSRIPSVAMRWLPSVEPPIPLRCHDARFPRADALTSPKPRRTLLLNPVLGVAERFGPSSRRSSRIPVLGRAEEAPVGSGRATGTATYGHRYVSTFLPQHNHSGSDAVWATSTPDRVERELGHAEPIS